MPDAVTATPQPVNVPTQDGSNLAENYCKQLLTHIEEFEKDLSDDEEVGAKLVNFDGLTVHVHSVGYWNPALICFYGVDSKNRTVRLVQHISQINLLLVKVKRLDPNRERIGFKSAHEEIAASTAP